MPTFTEIKTRRLNQKKHKKRFLALILVLLGAGIFFFTQNLFQREDLPIFGPTASPTPPVKTVTHYFVPVAEFESLKTDYSIAEIKQSQLVTLSDNVDIFPDGYEAEVLDLVGLESALQEGKIAILAPSQVKPQYKSLKINGVSMWDKQVDKKSYPLVYVEKRVGEEGAEENFKQEELSTIFVGGEIIPARAVDRLGLNTNNNYTYLFDGVKQDIARADIAIAQLENPLLGDPAPCTGCVVFVSDEKVAGGLKQVGFDILAASGNHMGDGGQAGYKRTAELLTEQGILFTGMGKGESEQLKPSIIEVSGRTIGMISADDVAYFYWSSSEETYGTNTFSSIDNGVTSINYQKVNKIKDIKAQYNIDYLIVYESWGIEYTNKANSHQVELAHALIDSGADLIVASHPHWVQNIEFYKDKPIFYALGNFIFDQTHTLPTRQSIVANLYYYEGVLKSVELIPLQVCGYHQTKNDLTGSYLTNEISLEDLINKPESDGCIWWQPRRVPSYSLEYKQILDRVFEFSGL